MDALNATESCTTGELQSKRERLAAQRMWISTRARDPRVSDDELLVLTAAARRLEADLNSTEFQRREPAPSAATIQAFLDRNYSGFTRIRRPRGLDRHEPHALDAARRLYQVGDELVLEVSGASTLYVVVHLQQS